MKKILAMFAATLLLFAGLSFAQELNERLSWTPPTQYTDNSPIAPGELVSYTISCGIAPGNYILTLTVPGDTTEASRALLMESMGLVLGGEYHCAVQATTANGLTSAYSNEVAFNVPDNRVPAAPVLSYN